MAGTVEDPLAKLTRADRQLDLLQEQVYAIWPPRKRWPVRAEELRAGLEYHFYLGEVPPIDPEWLLWAGEIMFDLRSALDHLVYQLYLRRFRGNIPAEIKRIPMFPIFDREAQFDQSGHSRIRHLSQRDLRAIRNLQPFVARDDKWFMSRRWLSRLDALHNIDKHRRLHVVAAAHTASITPAFPDEVGWEARPHWGAVESNSHIETWTFAKRPRLMHDHPGAYIDVMLDPDGESPIELATCLRRACATVRAVLHRFADRFPRIEGAFAPPTLDLPVGEVTYAPR